MKWMCRLYADRKYLKNLKKILKELIMDNVLLYEISGVEFKVNQHQIVKTY